MSIIQFSDKKDQEQTWVSIGKGWNHKTKAGMVSIRIGNKRSVDGQLVNVFEEITLKPDDVMILRPNTRKREGKQDPDFILALLTGGDESEDAPAKQKEEEVEGDDEK